MSKHKEKMIREKLVIESEKDFTDVLVITESGTFLIFKIRWSKALQFKDALESGVSSVIIKDEKEGKEYLADKGIKLEWWGYENVE